MEISLFPNFLQAASVDQSGYTRPGIVEDMEATCNAFGYDKINLYDYSDGTRESQVSTTSHTYSLRRAIVI